MNLSNLACCCRKFALAGLVASFFRVRCMRSWRPFCCGLPGLMRSMPITRRSQRGRASSHAKLCDILPLSSESDQHAGMNRRIVGINTSKSVSAFLGVIPILSHLTDEWLVCSAADISLVKFANARRADTARWKMGPTANTNRELTFGPACLRGDGNAKGRIDECQQEVSLSAT